MDWEKKFSTIVSETEANLERVKRRLEAARNPDTTYVPSFNDIISPGRRNYGHSNKAGHLPSPPYQQSGDTVTTAKIHSHSMSAASQDTGPPIWATVLEERMVKQQKVIDTLTETVVSLQHDKERQKHTITDLKEALVELQDRLHEKGIDLDTESKINQWKLQTSHEINDLKQQVRHYKHTEATNTAGILSMEELKNQVREVKVASRDETENVKKELDYYKVRMSRLEKNITTLGDQLEDMAKMHKQLKSDYEESSHKAKNDHREIISAISDRLVGNSIRKAGVTYKSDLNFQTTSSSAGHTMSPARLATSGHKSPAADKTGLRQPAQWRDLLSHSLSTISVESSDSNLSSGYMARKRSQSTYNEDVGLLSGGLADSDSGDDVEISAVLRHQDLLGSVCSGSSTSSPTSLSINDL